MKMCAFVTRVSDERQGTERGSSSDNQRIQLDRYLDFRNADAGDNPVEQLKLYKEYKLEGISGDKSFDSPQFKELESDILQGEIDIVLATGLDRFGRNVVKFLKFFQYLRDYGVDLVVTHYQIDTGTPTGQLVITILMALAEMQRVQLSEKIIHARHIKISQGFKTGGTIPLGFDKHPSRTGVYLINEIEGTIVRLAFDLYLERESLSAVARELNKRGYRTKRVPKKKGGFRGGKTYSADKLKYILTNYIYIGILEEHKANKNKPNSKVHINKRYARHTPENPDDWPVIVPKETFNDVQELLENRSKVNRKGTRQTYPYVLSGLVVCNFCGDTMGPEKGGGVPYYACKNTDCDGRKLIPEKMTRIKRNTIKAAVLEEAVLKLVADTLADDPANITQITEACNRALNSQIPEYIREIRALESEKSHHKSMADGLAISLADKGIDPFDASDITASVKEEYKVVSKLNKQIAELKDKLANARKKKISEAIIKRSLGLIAAFTEEQQKDLLRMFISEVRIGLEEIEAHLILDSIMYLPRNLPNPHEFVYRRGWYARQDLNPEPSGP